MLFAPRTLTACVVALAAAATLLVASSPTLRFAYEAPGLRISLETAGAMVALVVAFLVLGRFGRSRLLHHFVLVLALGFLALANLVLAAVVATSPAWPGWRAASVAATLVGAVFLAASPLLPRKRIARAGRVGVAIAVGGLAAWAAVALGLAEVFEARGRGGVSVPPDARFPQPISDEAILAVQVATMVAFLVAGFAYTRVSERIDDSFVRWVAVACWLAAFGRLHYILLPPIATGWVYTGDVFRLLFFLLLLLAAAREVRGYWAGLAERAVLEERRRIARDLHDGVAQELAFIDRRARRLHAGTGEAAAAQIAASAERALTDSRRAIAALTRPLDEPLEDILAQAVEEVAARNGAVVALDLDEGIDVGRDEREALVRIACEAVNNAVRHAHARTVRLELANGDRVRLRVVDDGVGFDPGAVEGTATGGFGLISMRERAAALGADFRVDSRSGRGTAVEVRLP